MLVAFANVVKAQEEHTKVFYGITKRNTSRMKNRSSKQAKACDISAKTKAIVWERDKHRCIICADPNAMPNAHALLSRAHGGLGIPENIVTLCRKCHHEYDHGIDREYYRTLIGRYLKKHYPDWDEEKVKYNKWTNGNCFGSRSPNNTSQ